MQTDLLSELAGWGCGVCLARDSGEQGSLAFLKTTGIEPRHGSEPLPVLSDTP